MRLTASDFYTYYRPSKCALRVYLRHRGEEEAPPGPYDDVIRRLGMRHEKGHLETFPAVLDLSAVPWEERKRRTRNAVAEEAPVIYQPLLRVTKQLGDMECEIVGEPDFLIYFNDGNDGRYLIRDSKISRRITEEDHPEILRQLGLYGWLYGHLFGRPPSALQVHSGAGEIVDIPYDGGMAAMEILQEILDLKLHGAEPYSPVGWSKCGGCGFHDRCWRRAKAGRDVALVAGVDQGLAVALRHQGIGTVDQFIAAYDEESLAGFHRPRGKTSQRVGKRAGAILRMARAMASGKEELFGIPAIPDHSNYVMFDLEGLPPQLDELEKIYLWGIQVFGERPGDYQAATAGFGEEGDRQGWEAFLQKAKGIFDDHGDIPFVHWHHYERVRLDMYADRHGDPDGIAARVRQNLLDLLPITQNSIALPLPSYSLKVIEKYIGFRRTQIEYGGDWAMAKYIEATETADEAARTEVLEQILTYNKEDLEATWAVLRWLKAKGYEDRIH